MAALLVFSSPFALNALAAATIVALACGLISPLVVARGLTFVVHSTSELAFTGAVAGLLVFKNPTAGAFLGAVLLVALLSRALRDHTHTDPTTGIILGAGVALGLFLLSFYHGFVSAATSILFGQIFGISSAQLWLLVAIAAVIVGMRLLLGSQLLFSIVDPQVAEVYGIRSSLFTPILVALVVGAATSASQIVGTLLVLTLSVAPGISAVQVARSYRQTVMLSLVFALIAADGGVLFALLYTDLRPSVGVAAISTALYLVTRLLGTRLKKGSA